MRKPTRIVPTARVGSGTIMSSNIALIAGITGTVGGALAKQLAGSGAWRVMGISRRRPSVAIEDVSYIRADLSNFEACVKALERQPSVTHLFYCARATHFEQPVESPQDNLQLFSRALRATERTSKKLRHVHLVQGGKYYGVHVGPFPTPARERDRRCVVSNFNYDQQDLLTRRSERAKWSWSSSRPNTLLHFSPHNPRNIVSTLGAYAAICRASGAAMDFPGPPGAYASLTQVTTLKLLARTMEQISTVPLCANNAFNVTNTDVFRWMALWPKIAKACSVETGTVRPMRLAEVMADKNELWRDICEREGLRATKLSEVANWAFADATLERYWDEILCHNKARNHGLAEWDDSEKRFVEIMKSYQAARILP